MKIFVVGGTGFLGTNVAIHLKNLGHEVTIQGRDPVKCATMSNKGFEVIREDVTASTAESESAIRKACSENDIVINCLGDFKPYGRYEDFVAANVYSVDLLTAACLKAPNLPKFIHISSPLLYANLHEYYNIDENTPLPAEPICEYVKTKRDAEAIVKNAEQHGLAAIMIRPEKVYGVPSEGGSGDDAFLARIVKTHQTGHFPVFNHGQALIDVLHIDNFVQFIEIAVNQFAAMQGKTFNLTDDDPRRFKEILDILCKELGVPVNTINSPLDFKLVGKILKMLEKTYPFMRKMGVDINPSITSLTVSLFALTQTHDVSLAKQYGYEPKMQIEEGIKAWVQHWKATHPEKKHDYFAFFKNVFSQKPKSTDPLAPKIESFSPRQKYF